MKTVIVSIAKTSFWAPIIVKFTSYTYLPLSAKKISKKFDLEKIRNIKLFVIDSLLFSLIIFLCGFIVSLML
jgi:hypothetical protein